MDDNNVNNGDLVLGFSCGGAGGSVFPQLVNFRYERISAFQPG